MSYHRSKNAPVKTSAKGRVCKKYGCSQRLSIYNGEDYCHVHRKDILD